MPGFRPWRVAASLACGHMAALAVMAAAVAWRLPLERPLLQWGATLLLAVALACRLRQGHGWAGQAGLALWSFLLSIAHGAGMVLVPALMSLCGANGGAGGPLPQILAALGAHLALLLAANGAFFYLAARLVQWVKA